MEAKPSLETNLNKEKKMNPYRDIRKVPLDFEGISSSAYAIQRETSKGWKEAGVVGHNYLLVPNAEVRDAAEMVARESSINFTLDKEFFNGKNFIYSMKSNHTLGEVEAGDDVALGIQFWNSYDGSRSFGFRMMLYRLACTNGMMSKHFFNTYKFSHHPNSEDWKGNLNDVVRNINNIASGSKGLDKFISDLKVLNENNLSTETLGVLRHEYLRDLPDGLWGQIVTKFTNPKGEYFEKQNGWNLLNASTDILWHKEKPTMASYQQNAMIVDGLCNAARYEAYWKR